MNDVVIRAEGLSKQYRVGARAPYQTLRERVSGLFSGALQAKTNPEPRFWALKDVSFDVRRGEVVGIIGRNGAGKSTLLKILSRITEPSEGTAKLRGRVGSLLEVGTGFHPELTGRENVFLNGAVLGMRRTEIARKFADIVAFAEIEKFIDTPVKYYSSGMYMRLAFAVAAHLEPEVLIVDEVLAVGDAAFQQKCLGKMGQLARSGRTILFVSHNLAAVEALTRRCVYLEAGRVALCSDTRTVTAAYQARTADLGTGVPLARWTDRKRSGDVEVVHFECLNERGESAVLFTPRERIRLRVRLHLPQPTTIDVAIGIETAAEQSLFTTHLSDVQPLRARSGEVEFVTEIFPNPLRQGRYLTTITVGTNGWTNLLDVIYHYPAFEVAGHPADGFFPLDCRWGPLHVPCAWETT